MKRVGITSSGLSIDYMQQVKFNRVATCMEQSVALQTSTADRFIIASPDKRKNLLSTGNQSSSNCNWKSTEWTRGRWTCGLPSDALSKTYS